MLIIELQLDLIIELRCRKQLTNNLPINHKCLESKYFILLKYLMSKLFTFIEWHNTLYINTDNITRLGIKK